MLGSKREPDITPGPGQYSPASTLFDGPKHRIAHTVKRDVPPETINCEMYDARIFPEQHPARIGEITYERFPPPDINTEPRYNVRSSFAPARISIHSRLKPERIPVVPPPGAYTPKFPSRKSPSFAFSGPAFRDEWLNAKNTNPPPGEYDVKQTPVMPLFTIGYKSRKRCDQRTPMPVGQFIAKLNKSIDIRDARRYIQSHHELIDLVNFVLDSVYAAKPDDPITYLNELAAGASFAAMSSHQRV